MATIPVNPERRDPGYFRKKADIGLSNVDNISATDFINTVADDVKIIGNRKIITNKFSAPGKEYYIGILKTSELNSHVNFSTGLFNDKILNKELAQFNVDFSYSTQSAFTVGNLGYSIQVPDSDQFLKDLELIFTQVGSILYVLLYSKSLPKETDSNFFNRIGTNITEWTEGVCLIEDDSNKLYDTIKGGKELVRLKLNSSHTTIQSEFCESLPVYNKEDGSRVLIEPRSYSSSELEELDYPAINGVPFIARKGVKINNQEDNDARNIIVPAKHPGSTKEEAGGHDWSVLNDFKAIAYEFIKGPQAFGRPRVDLYRPITKDILNDNSQLSNQYGLCKPSKYSTITGIYSDYDSASERAKSWLDSLGPDDSDVITVGLFRHFMDFMFSEVFTNMNTTPSEETISISYSSWNINTRVSSSTIPSSGKECNIWISASRIKTTTTYGSDGSVIDSVSETESASVDTNQISVSISPGDGGLLLSPETGSNRWTYSIPENKDSYTKTYHLLVYVDYGKSSEKFETITFTQDAYKDELVKTTYSIETFRTSTSVVASENTQDINYLIRVNKSYVSGNTIIEYYDGEEVTITVPEASVSFIKNGLYRVTYPKNTESTQKVYAVTLTYKTVEHTLTIEQAAATDVDTIVGFGYVFEASPQQVVFEALGSSKNIKTLSYSVEYHSISDPTKIEDISYTVKSKPSWINVIEDVSDFINDLYISIEANNQNFGRQGELVLEQETSGKTLTITISQKGKSVTEVSNTWDVYNFNMDTSMIKLSGETRNCDITYRNIIKYSNGVEKSYYYSGEDIEVKVKTIYGDKKATVDYDNGWKITFPESTTINVYQVSASYKNIETGTRTINQGKLKTRVDYVFEIDKVDIETSAGLSGGSFNSNTKTINISNIASVAKVYFKSYTIDYFDDGSSMINSSDFIPFTYNSGSYITNIDRNNNILTLSIPENTSSQRTDLIQVTQNISGKTLSFYVTQASSSLGYSIKINSVKYFNNSTYTLAELNRGEGIVPSQKITIKPVKTINGVDNEMPGSEIYVSEDINWLETSYDSSTGVLSVVATSNNSGSIRKGTIYLNYQNGGVNISVSVSQQAGSSYIKIEESTGETLYQVNKSKEAQIVTLNVESNYPYSISGSSNWVSVLDGVTKSAGSSLITFDLKENNYSSSRSFEFTLSSEGGTTRKIRITQSSRTNYIDVVGFENSDLLVTTSYWKQQICIPIKAGQPYFIDYYSDWLKVGLGINMSTSNFSYKDNAIFFNSMNNGEGYLYISPVIPSNARSGGVVSLSYYDSDTGTIVCGRKIFVNNMPLAKVLPYGSRDIFVSGDQNDIKLYAYVKEGVTDLSGYCKNKSEVNDSDNIYTLDSIEPENNLSSLTVTVPVNENTKYRDIYYTVYSKSSGDSVESYPAFRVHQYPRKYLNCYYVGSKYGRYVKNLRVAAEGDELIGIQANVNCSSGYWEFYGNSIPGWISVVGDISVPVGGSNSFGIKVEPNSDTEPRVATLQFWCDSDHNTINTITITQEGLISKAPRKTEYEYSLVTATSKSNSIYLYGVTSAYVAKTVGSDGKSEENGVISTTISRVNNAIRIEYSVGTKNSYYYKDIYKVINLNCEDGVIRQFFIKNKRESEVSISIARERISTGSGYSNAVQNYILSSNIGLTGFYQGTYYNLEKSQVDFTTLEVSSKASYTSYGDNYYNPEKLFYKPQVMDKLLLRNMDVIPGYMYERPIKLPPRTDTSLKKLGICIYNENGDIISSMDDFGGTSIYSLTLPSNQKDSNGSVIWKSWSFRAYDGVTMINSGTGFSVTCLRSDITKKVGSLGKVSFSVSSTSDNTGTSSKYLGSITLSITNGTKKIIHIYQQANVVNLVGKAGLNGVKENTSNYAEKWTSSEANLLYRGSDSSWDLTFVHQYSNWMFVDLMESSGFTFNGKSYSGTFGNGGNSGTASSVLANKIDGCDYRSTVSLTPPRKGLLLTNETLDMLEGGRFGLISTYGTNNITDKSNVKSIVHVYTRPDIPDFTVYNTLGQKVKGSTGETGPGTLSSFGVHPVSSSPTVLQATTYSLTFRLTSNYINRCKKYIGKTIKMDGKDVKIETEYDLFIKLLNNISVDYKLGDVTNSVLVRPSSYTTGESNNESYLQYTVTIKVPLSSTISSGNLNITLNDFVIDPNLYYPHLPSSISTPIHFSSSRVISNPDITIKDPKIEL